MLGHHAKFKALSLENILTASDGTRKNLLLILKLKGKETVVIPCNRGRATICVPSQVDCAMICLFCYTRRQGVKRYLSTAGIAERAVFAQHLLANEVFGIETCTFQEMGEPLQNINSVLKAANITVHDQGLHFSPRKVTVSTSGLVPQLKHFLHESNCALAVTTDD
ncbi:hypothetical protein NC652_021982 [Populus alba x Populus x berolinensis]|nr:hypothetical protein NC652_021982 [Populus alba x Populus x berolinensis]